jgi:hypothetical protein
MKNLADYNSIIDKDYYSYDEIKELKPYRTFYKENESFKTAKKSLQSLITSLEMTGEVLILQSK